MNEQQLRTLLLAMNEQELRTLLLEVRNEQERRELRRLLKQLSGQRRPTKPSARDDVIHGAIAGELRGPEYCKYLDAKKVEPLPQWKNWPGSYAAAYRATEAWRKTINREKSRVAARHDKWHAMLAKRSRGRP